MKYYLNLTNGIEFLDKFYIENKGFVRIQSTYCEQKLWDLLLRDLDYQFLLDLALGETIYVLDTSQQKNESRAIYQGLQFIKYALNKIWFNKEIEINVKNVNCKMYFRECFDNLSEITLNKIRYVRKFLNTEEIKLNSICFRTTKDGNYEYYRKILLEKYKVVD